MQVCPWKWDYHGNLMENVPWDGMDSTHCISHETDGTKIDEQKIENLLNEHSDSEYECQNDNEL